MLKLNPQAAEPFYIQAHCVLSPPPLPVLPYIPMVPLYYNTQCYLLYPTIPSKSTTHNPLPFLQNNTQPSTSPTINNTDDAKNVVVKEGFSTPPINIPPPKSYYKRIRKDQACWQSYQRNKKMTCRSVWRPKGVSIDGEVQALPPDPNEFNKFKGKTTTLMLKNIPNKKSKKVLLAVLDKHCVEENTKLEKQDDQSAYDFV